MERINTFLCEGPSIHSHHLNGGLAILLPLCVLHHPQLLLKFLQSFVSVLHLLGHEFPVEVEGKEGEKQDDRHQQHCRADGGIAGVAKELDPAEEANLNQEEQDTQHSGEGPGCLDVPGESRTDL